MRRGFGGSGSILTQTGGTIAVNSDGSITLTPASGKTVGIGVAPVSNVRLKVKGTSTSASDYVFTGYDSSDQLLCAFNNDGRLDMLRYNDVNGSILALGIVPVTPTNGQLCGHVGYLCRDSNNAQNTCVILGGTIDTVAAGALNSTAKFGYMDSVDASGGANQQPNKYMTLSKAGLVLPSIQVDFGSTNFDTPGNSAGWRLRVYNSGANASSYGFGVVGGQLWGNVGTGGNFGWYVNAASIMTLSATDLTVGPNIISSTGAVGTKVKAGAPSDSDVTNPVSGMIIGDSTNNKIWIRLGTSWKGVAVA